MLNNPKITFTCVTYNRWKMLRNLLLSFVKTNCYDNFEWIILHHDCNDNTVDFLNSVQNDEKYDMMKGKLKIIDGGTDKEYLEFLNNQGIDVNTPKKAQLSHFPKWRNSFLEHMEGEIWIDLPDDHQFIWKGNYCQHIVDVFNDRIEKTGYNDLSLLTFRTRFFYRIMKANNKKSEVIKTKSGIEYYTIETKKRHDEWHATTIENFKKINFYPQLENASEEIRNKWNEPKHPQYYFFHHISMNELFYEKNLKRVDFKIPIMHDCLDSKYESSATENNTIFPIFKEEEIKHICKGLNRPLAISEFEQVCINIKNSNF